MASIYSLDGKSKGKIELPEVFKTPYRPDVIQRAVVAEQSARRQPYGPTPSSGLLTSADYFGRRRGGFRQTINRGMTRLPREKPGGGGLGKVRRIPQSVGGRKAHPPKSQDYAKGINNKERLLALKSAIAASIDRDIILGRGHLLEGILEVPVIADETIESISKSKDLLSFLSAVGLGKEVERTSERKNTSGVARRRGRVHKVKKSVLVIVDADNGIIKSASNIPGVEAATLNDLTVELLAPGGVAGRLTVWSTKAIENINKIEDGATKNITIPVDG